MLLDFLDERIGFGLRLTIQIILGLILALPIIGIIVVVVLAQPHVIRVQPFRVPSSSSPSSSSSSSSSSPRQFKRQEEEEEEENEEEYDEESDPVVNAKNEKVLIIGSGTAGLFCGYALEYAGFVNYEILEASSPPPRLRPPPHPREEKGKDEFDDNEEEEEEKEEEEEYREGDECEHEEDTSARTGGFGGRVKELPAGALLDLPLDLGAEWIHGHPRVLRDLLLIQKDRDDVGTNVRTISYRPRTYGTWHGGRVRRRDWLRFLYREYKFERTTWYSYLRRYVLPYVKSKIRYGASVKSIDRTSGGPIRVATHNGRVHEADRVVVTVPLTILQDGDIEFTPPLPPYKTDAIKSVYMPSGIKVWLVFDRRFYPDVQICGTLGELMADDEDVTGYFDALWGKPTDGHCLVYFSVGSSARRLCLLESDDEIVSRLLSELDAMYDGMATRHFVKCHVQNWTREPFVRGGYSADWDDYPRNIIDLGRTVDGRLYFAGEHTDTREVATVPGAALSGRRAAQAILDDSVALAAKRGERKG